MLFDYCVLQQKVSLTCMFKFGGFLAGQSRLLRDAISFFVLLFSGGLPCMFPVHVHHWTEAALAGHRRYQQVHWYLLVL